MIKRLWNDRRGVSAWVVTIAMVPLLGMVSLGTEVGSWYAIRKNAQNAADAAAIAGATALAVNDPTTPATAGQAFAESNGFATGGGICPPPSTMATPGQNVCIIPSGTTGAAGTTVTAFVTQYQSPIFTQWFLPKGTVTIPIQATAVATIQQQKTGRGYCALAQSALSVSGSTALGGPCGLMSNGTFDPPPPGQVSNTFPGAGWTVGAHIGCDPHGNGQIDNTDSQCNLSPDVRSNYSAPTVPLPPALVNLMANADHIPTEPTGMINNVSGTPSPSTTTWLGNYTVSGNVTLPPGVYMFDSLQVDGTLSGTGVNFIIGSGGLSGKGTMNLTTGDGGGVNGFPDMNGVLIYDQEVGDTTKKFTGNFTGDFNGAIYFPNANLTFRGGGTLTSPGCMVVVANVLNFGGNSSMDTSGCSNSVLSNDVPQAYVVMLTQ